VGGTTVHKVDFRLIAATNQNLEEMVAAGRFRADLYYRLNVIPIHIPPLRERKEDLVPLARHLLDQITRDLTRPHIKLHPSAEDALNQYDWPGNARELSNVLERVCSGLEKDTVYSSDLPFYLKRKPTGLVESTNSSLRDVTSNSESEAIRYALERANNNKSRAAEILGIHRTLLYKKMKKYGIGAEATPPSHE